MFVRRNINVLGFTLATAATLFLLNWTACAIFSVLALAWVRSEHGVQADAYAEERLRKGSTMSDADADRVLDALTHVGAPQRRAAYTRADNGGPPPQPGRVHFADS